MSLLRTVWTSNQKKCTETRQVGPPSAENPQAVQEASHKIQQNPEISWKFGSLPFFDLELVINGSTRIGITVRNWWSLDPCHLEISNLHIPIPHWYNDILVGFESVISCCWIWDPKHVLYSRGSMTHPVKSMNNHDFEHSFVLPKLWGACFQFEMQFVTP